MKHPGKLLIAAVAILSSCVHETALLSPYYITSALVSTEAEKDVFQFAGAYIDFYNNSEKEISSVDFSFHIYDSQGEPVGLGINGIRSTYAEPIPSESPQTFIISLDHVIGPVIDEAYSIDFITVRKICYADGSTWENPFALRGY